MRHIAFDSESHLIRAGMIFPKPVCLSWAEGDKSGLVLADEGHRLLREWLADPEVLLVGANVAFDFGVFAADDPTLLPAIFAAYDAGRVWDVQIRQQLVDIARGELKFRVSEDGTATKSTYSLADLSLRLLGKHLEKKDTWRLRYALLDGVPVTEWPEEARTYAIDDALTTLRVCVVQELSLEGDAIPDSERQHRAAWALHLMSGWGLRTDPEAVAKLSAHLEESVEATMSKLRGTDILRTDAKGDHKVMSAIRKRVEAGFATQGKDPPLTDTGKVGTSEEALRDSGDPELLLLAEGTSDAKLLGSFVPVLRQGLTTPITCRYGLVETGRVSCSAPNLTQLPRKGGVRECFVARPGTVFGFVDYSTIELRAFAQNCLDLFGYSRMADALRDGKDLHLLMAAQILGQPYEDTVAQYKAGDKRAIDARQIAKVANFGKLGAAGAKSFVAFAKENGFPITPEQSTHIHEAFLSLWTEAQEYFAWISGLTATGEGTVVHFMSGRVRGCVPYCAAANSFFQGRVADLAKEALYEVTREALLDSKSPLRGSHPTVFVHDEIITSIPYDPARPESAARAVARQKQVMLEVAQRWLPDVPVLADEVMCKRWYKGAAPAYVDGVLVPSKPQKVTEGEKTRTIWVADV